METAIVPGREPTGRAGRQTRMHLRSRLAIFTGLLLAWGVLGACGSDGSASNASGTIEPPTATEPSTTEPSATEPLPTEPVATTPPEPVDTAAPMGAPVAIVDVAEAVAFYPACGNERLDHDGVTWSPVVRAGSAAMNDELQARADEIFAVDRDESPVAGVQGFARVVAPGPGDDVGTLVVWADGVARWVSDSGDLDVWMIDDEVPYYWVC